MLKFTWQDKKDLYNLCLKRIVITFYKSMKVKRYTEKYVGFCENVKAVDLEDEKENLPKVFVILLATISIAAAFVYSSSLIRAEKEELKLGDLRGLYEKLKNFRNENWSNSSLDLSMRMLLRSMEVLSSKSKEGLTFTKKGWTIRVVANLLTRYNSISPLILTCTTWNDSSNNDPYNCSLESYLTHWTSIIDHWLTWNTWLEGIKSCYSKDVLEYWGAYEWLCISGGVYSNFEINCSLPVLYKWKEEVTDCVRVDVLTDNIKKRFEFAYEYTQRQHANWYTQNGYVTNK